MHLPDFGPYAIWVWPAYGCTLLVFAINIAIALRDRARFRRERQDERPS